MDAFILFPMKSNYYHIVKQITKLVEAENGNIGVKDVEHILSDAFHITRSKGEEQDKRRWLEGISRKKKSNIVRKLEDKREIFESNDLSVVRSVIRMKSKSVSRRYRNIHVFANETGIWRCKIWQVTKLKLKTNKV